MSINSGARQYLFGRFMELLDLAFYELRPVIGYYPTEKLDVLCTRNLVEYKSTTGMDFWISGVARGSHLVFEPVSTFGDE